VTDQELAAIRERLDRITPDRWFVRDGTEVVADLGGDGTRFVRVAITAMIGAEMNDEVRQLACDDAEFIANAPSDLAALLAEVDILRGLLSDRVLDSDFATEIERRGMKAGAEVMRRGALDVLSKCRLGKSGGLVAGIMDRLKHDIAGLPAPSASQ